LEHASVCLTRIAEAFASSPGKLDELCNHGLVAQAASLISTSSSGGGQASLNAPTYTVKEVCTLSFKFYVMYFGLSDLRHSGLNSTAIHMCNWLSSRSQNITSSWGQWHS